MAAPKAPPFCSERLSAGERHARGRELRTTLRRGAPRESIDCVIENPWLLGYIYVHSRSDCCPGGHYFLAVCFKESTAQSRAPQAPAARWARPQSRNVHYTKITPKPEPPPAIEIPQEDEIKAEMPSLSKIKIAFLLRFLFLAEG